MEGMSWLLGNAADVMGFLADEMQRLVDDGLDFQPCRDDELTVWPAGIAT
jgi:hypothetical protein